MSNTLNSFPYNGKVAVDHAARTQCLEFSPNGWIKKWNKKSWMMNDENKEIMLQNQNLQ